MAVNPDQAKAILQPLVSIYGTSLRKGYMEALCGFYASDAVFINKGKNCAYGREQIKRALELIAGYERTISDQVFEATSDLLVYKAVITRKLEETIVTSIPLVMASRKRATGATASEVQQDEPEEVAAKVARNDDSDGSNNAAGPQETASVAVQRELARMIDRIAELEEQLSLKELKIISQDDQMNQETKTFKTAFALQKRKITNLESQLAEKTRLLEEKTKEFEAEKKRIIDEKTMEVAIEKAKAAAIAKPAIPVNDPTVIRTFFSDVSKITEASSKTVSSANANWKFDISKNNDKLGFYVEARPLPLSDRTFWHAFVTFRLLSHKDLSVVFEYTMSSMKEYGTWGNPHIMKWQKLLDPNEKFIKEDSIIAEVIIREVDLPLPQTPPALDQQPAGAAVQPQPAARTLAPSTSTAVQPRPAAASTSAVQPAAAAAAASSSTTVQPSAAAAQTRPVTVPSTPAVQTTTAAVQTPRPTVQPAAATAPPARSAVQLAAAAAQPASSSAQPAAAVAASPSVQSTSSTVRAPSATVPSTPAVQTTPAAVQTPRAAVQQTAATAQPATASVQPAVAAAASEQPTAVHAPAAPIQSTLAAQTTPAAVPRAAAQPAAASSQPQSAQSTASSVRTPAAPAQSSPAVQSTPVAEQTPRAAAQPAAATASASVQPAAAAAASSSTTVQTTAPSVQTRTAAVQPIPAPVQSAVSTTQALSASVPSTPAVQTPATPVQPTPAAAQPPTPTVRTRSAARVTRSSAAAAAAGPSTSAAEPAAAAAPSSANAQPSSAPITLE